MEPARPREAENLLHVETLGSAGSVAEAFGGEHELAHCHATGAVYRRSFFAAERVGARDELHKCAVAVLQHACFHSESHCHSHLQP